MRQRIYGMAKITLYLKEPGALTPTPLFFMVSSHGTRAKVYTGVSVLPAHWLQGEQRLRTNFAPAEVKDKQERKQLSSDNEAKNVQLSSMRERLSAYHRDQLALGILPTAEDLRTIVEPQVAQPQAVDTPLPLSDFAAYIARMHQTKAAATIKSLKTTCGHLTHFWEQSPEGRRGAPLLFDHFTADFSHLFTGYLINVEGLLDGSIHKHLSILKRFLNDATLRGRSVNQAYTRWRWEHREPDVLALTTAELRSIEALDLPNGHHLNNARALFLIGCYTGLRFSDVAVLKQEHDKGEYLRLTTKKTRDTLTIPIHPKARPLLDAMWIGGVHPISNQRLNAYIKELAKRAGVDEPTEHIRYQGGKRQAETLPKYELISSHTARRTFVSLSLEGGLPFNLIMKATGHRDMKSFQRYVQTTDTHQLAGFRKLWDGENEVNNKTK
ncbi:site-specific integrase [Hymenobacter radiodurans]|uniref:site-specific integrase n=1 Tax=Hymenobacter radiodurans TaxID=2496028 RepID=UPI0010584437|nr:site-specific integrase [Hymenobacter radiodurans]